MSRGTEDSYIFNGRENESVKVLVLLLADVGKKGRTLSRHNSRDPWIGAHFEIYSPQWKAHEFEASWNPRGPWQASVRIGDVYFGVEWTNAISTSGELADNLGDIRSVWFRVRIEGQWSEKFLVGGGDDDELVRKFTTRLKSIDAEFDRAMEYRRKHIAKAFEDFDNSDRRPIKCPWGCDQ